MTDFFAYKAGHVASGNWHWSVGAGGGYGGGHPSEIASINHTACFVRCLDPHRLALVMAASEPLLEALDRLVRAAANRENTMGDPLRLLDVQAELRAATEQARAALALTKGDETCEA